jgi:hypothetical protein
MSIPRDLRVNIPGHGIDKFNVAYSYGGPKLTEGHQADHGIANINHVVNVDHGLRGRGQPDRLRLRRRRPALPLQRRAGAAEQYAIDIPAGYQRMCVKRASRPRHDTTLRSARQQEFARAPRLPAGR